MFDPKSLKYNDQEPKSGTRYAKSEFERSDSVGFGSPRRLVHRSLGEGGSFNEGGSDSARLERLPSGSDGRAEMTQIEPFSPATCDLQLPVPPAMCSVEKIARLQTSL
jgi:hypothetical protein